MNARGFTLIELVIVIIILGILAVTALPKFINLKSDAQTSVLQGIQAAMQGAVAKVHSKSIVKGNQNNASGTVSLFDGDIDIGYGYPLAPTSSTEAYWSRLLNLNSSEFTIKLASNDDLIIYSSDLGDINDASASCILVYDPPSAANIKPQITLNPCV